MKGGAQEIGDRGFTLLELMAVVVIIGMLAATAVPMFSKYIKKSKSAEAPLNIRKIYDGEVTYYYEERVTAAGEVLPKRFAFLPPQPPFPPERRKRFGNFQRPGWPMIKFSSDSPMFYSYMADVHPPRPGPPLPVPLGVPPFPLVPPSVIAAAVIRAIGDLDGDGKFSMFERTTFVDVTRGEPEGFHGVFTFDELE